MLTQGSNKTSRRCAVVFALVALLCAACSPFAVLNATVPDDGYEVTADHSYGAHPRHRLDVYTPEPATEERPVVVFFYGGSWKRGERANYRFVGEALTSRGFLVVIPDYRTYPEGRFPDFMEDAAQALHWVLTHIREYGGDPNRVYMLGHSAGAHIAALLTLDRGYLARVGVNTCSIRGTAGLSGPYAFDPLAYRSVRPVFEHLDDPDLARPITFARGDAPAMLLLHGAADRTVRPDNSERLAERLREAGNPVRYVAYEDVGHVGIILALAAGYRERAPVLDDLVAFFEAEGVLERRRAVHCQGRHGQQQASTCGDCVTSAVGKFQLR
jgi:acetyl esterase/lipase